MKEILTSAAKYISEMIGVITNHGIWKILEVIIITMLLAIALNPEIILKIAEREKAKIAIEKKEFRKENDPLIRSALHDAIYEVGACRASVLEFHNGKENPSGLGFFYADMNYEIVRDTKVFVSDQYQNINLSLLELPNILYNNGFWYGSVEALCKVDPKLGSMIASNGTNWIAFLLLEGSVELGILEISFAEEPKNKQEIGREIRKLGTIVASKLDFKGE